MAVGPIHHWSDGHSAVDRRSRFLDGNDYFFSAVHVWRFGAISVYLGEFISSAHSHRSSIGSARPAAFTRKGFFCPARLKRGAPLLSVRQTHDECQGNVESADVIVVEMSDMPSDARAPNRHRFIGHRLRPHS